MYAPPPLTASDARSETLLCPLRTLEDLALCGIVVDNELFEEMTLHDGEGSNDSSICPFLTNIDNLFPQFHYLVPWCATKYPEVHDFFAGESIDTNFKVF